MSPVCGPRAREVGRPATPCENAVLLCETRDGDVSFPLRIETKRIASGEMNTWATEIDGTEGSIAFSTKLPKTLRFMDYQPGGWQAWQTLDLARSRHTRRSPARSSSSGSPTRQMWAAFLDELARGREGMRQPFHCATPEEAASTHRLFTAALRSHAERTVVSVTAPGDTAGAEYGFPA